MINQRFGRLVVQSKLPPRNRHTYWKCLCDCGATPTFRDDLLKSGRLKSCGCYRRERMKGALRPGRQRSLSIEQVNLIRRRMNEGLTPTQIALEMAVSAAVVRGVTTGRTYRDVA